MQQKSPSKISPDNIKNAIVEVRYTPKVPFDLVVGFLYNLFVENGFNHTVRPMPNVPISFNSGPQVVNIAVGNQNIFYNKRISINVLPNVFAISWNGVYEVWATFIAQIVNVMSLIEKAGIVGSYSRIGVRYISEYPKTNLRDCVKFDFTFNRPDIISNSFQFRSEFPLEEYTVLLSLNHNQQTITASEKTITHSIASVIDIDVIREFNSSNVGDLIAIINNAHATGKDLFFSLLRPEFLKTLNPVYEQ